MTAPCRGIHVDVPNGRLLVEDQGQGTPIVLVPPFACDTRAFDDQVDVLLDAGFRVITYDPRGYGRSTLPKADAPYSHADDLVAVLDQLGLDSAHLVGVSNGARIAIDAALLHPARLRTLTAIGAAISGYATPDVGAQFGELHRTAVTKGVTAAKEGLKRLGFFRPAYGQPRLVHRFDEMLATYSGFHLVNADPEMLPSPPTSERLAEIRARTLVMIGEREMPEYRQIAQQLARSVPIAEFMEVPGVGHFANLEAPAIVNAALLAFLPRS